MALWNRALALLDRISTPRIVDAHCDIPCGIYDPRTAQIAAQTVATLTQKMIDLPWPGDSSDATARDAYANTMS
ncbi:MAG: superoxide dismutase [Ni], partial [Dehalococcoidia bacterium]